MLISQSLIKEVLKKDHCPRQIMEAFINGKDLLQDSETLKSGRYFESELIGACRGGLKQEPTYLYANLKPKSTATKADMVKYININDKSGFDTVDKNNKELKEHIKFMPSHQSKEKSKAYKDLDELVLFAVETLTSLGLDISKGESQVDIKTKFLRGALDHVNDDINGFTKAIYDVKWTATTIDDWRNGWANAEEKEEAIIQACHYTLVFEEKHGYKPPFYFLVFGKSKWFRCLEYKLSEDVLQAHRDRIIYTKDKVREYSEIDYKGNGGFNKCIKCLFREGCPDKSTKPSIEEIYCY